MTTKQDFLRPLTPYQMQTMSRDKWDRYYTPQDCANTCVDFMMSRYPDLVDQGNLRIVEPHCGQGAFVHALAEYASYISVLCTVDIDPEIKPILEGDSHFYYVHINDNFKNLNLQNCHMVIGNPPYKDNLWEHLVQALKAAPRVGFLLRSTALAGTIKKDASGTSFRSWLKENPPKYALFLNERVKFTGPGAKGHSDTANHIFAIWDQGHTGPTELHFTSWRKRA